MPVLLPPALVRSLDLLRCPTCRARQLRADGRALRCSAGHTFDVARHGYAALLTGARATSGDDAAMTRARARFLATGAYASVRDAVARLAAESAPERATVVDVGCGTGYYLTGVLDRLPGARGLGLDTSVGALRSTARAHTRVAAAAWDVFRPFPLADGVADVVLDVFAPRNPAEFHRVLRTDGRLIVVRPTGRHLAELRGRLPAMVTVDPAKEQRLHRALDPRFEAAVTEQVEYAAPLAEAQALDLVAMTPSARHVSRADLDADGFPPGRVTVSVRVTAYRPR
ncbi:methyltransferase domain-containing protein [Streptomyces sp. RY43-2]|uniref:Methyltransferase domain-containing protein n=1 Tax=Streptomyces macrolidinus TaxID=2952607 RepID=A0ABT0Z948_9ACTN|nr:methyltransferase domain-containing protein [Streptomyces macrolidinus]MCN9240295.1 methyltransferase domain-containing protein [Streptomyces macrolidinus]